VYESRGIYSLTAYSKLLLRIYGPQVEHLIDREAELQILRRLGRKKIGPRLLGTFSNGRFEEFFHARTLKPQDLRDPEISKQIAKRMRELHDGIELLAEERDNGPFIWRNWDKWVDRCEKIVSYTDKQIMSVQKESSATSLSPPKRQKLLCGTDWTTFRKTVERYREWLDEQYGGADALREHLVFAHNDVSTVKCFEFAPGSDRIDAIWKHTPDGTTMRVTTSATCQSAQAARRD